MHDRLSHTLGVIEASERMIRALEQNAHNRRTYGSDRDESVPVPSEMDRTSIRLAALLHDVGHGCFSHAIEPVFEKRYRAEFDSLYSELRKLFAGTGKISPSEAIAALIVLSLPMAD